jgi:hypothetical protein
MERLVARAVERRELKAMPPPPARQQTIVEIVNDVLMPLATNFGDNC